MKVGLDVGSTTIKCVVMSDKNQLLYKSYERHFSQITQKMSELLNNIKNNIIKDNKVMLTVSGSAGMDISQACSLPFTQPELR